MVKHLLKRFLTAMILVFAGLCSMIFFMKSSKPETPQTDTAQANTVHKHASSEDHKKCAARVIGTNLPAILLQDTDTHSFSTVEMSEKQTVIVIRYLGYGCSHCIEQLLTLQKSTSVLDSAKVRVVAFSDDTPEQNAIVVGKYKFDPRVFTFAFDPAKSMGRSIGAVYTEEDGSKTELHVAMIVRKGRVEFAHFDTKPMTDIQALVRLATMPM